MPTQKLQLVFRLPSLLKAKKNTLRVSEFNQRKQQILLEHLTGGYQNSIQEFSIITNSQQQKTLQMDNIFQTSTLK
jgi:hypothetical protein